jgi:hypothetical protein
MQDLVTSMEIRDRIKRLNERLARHIPPRETWTPGEEALFRPTDVLRVPVEEAHETQLKAIKYAFSRHYTLNHFYHRYCDKRGILPDDIKTYDDLERIPLLPDLTFKQHPSGEDFAHWIANIYTGDLPTVVINTPDPTFDDVINAFNAAGLAVAFSSGTSGRHTVIPRDLRTMSNFQYALGKIAVGLSDDLDADHSLLLLPKATQTNLAVAKLVAIWSDLCNDVVWGLDLEISAEVANKAMTREDRLKNAPSADERGRKTVENAIKWLDRYAKTADTIRLVAFPFLVLQIMAALERQGKSFDFGERGTILTGGGWKMSEDKRILAADLRKQIAEVFGIPETRCLDLYEMTEMNACCYTCSEGHYFHLPYTWLKPFVLDRSFMPTDYGEWGRFGFLDSLANSYPGFIITGDQVRMLEHCPVCDRPGPVLEPSVQRAPSEEMRSCAEEVRRVLGLDLEGKK